MKNRGGTRPRPKKVRGGVSHVPRQYTRAVKRIEDGELYIVLMAAAGSSCNSSNNTNKETTSGSSGSSGSADRSASSGRFDTATIRQARRSNTASTTTADDRIAAAAVSPAEQRAHGGGVASPGGSGSFDDEWSRQMDELDRLRPPVVVFDGDDEDDQQRLVVDSFTDLPDIVVDDEDANDANVDGAASVKQRTVDQVMFLASLCLCSVVIFVVYLQGRA